MARFIRRFFSMLLAVIALSGVCVIGTAKPAAAWSPYTVDQAYWNWARPALYERYVFGGAMGFIDNDVWDAPAYEGQDCSSYVSKAWALPRLVYRYENFRDGSVMYTGSWYSGSVAGTVNVGWNDGVPIAHYFMNAFVWHQNGNVNNQHMGLTMDFDYSTGNYYTFEALNSYVGIVTNYRTWQDIEQHTGAWGKRFIRADWAA